MSLANYFKYTDETGDVDGFGAAKIASQIVLTIITVVTLGLSFYTVDAGERAIVLQWGLCRQDNGRRHPLQDPVHPRYGSCRRSYTQGARSSIGCIGRLAARRNRGST